MTHYLSDELKIGTTSRRFYYRRSRSDEVVIGQTFIDQQYDLGRIKRAHELLDFLRDQEEKGGKPLIVDAGANIGASCVYFAAIFPNARVVAIEPDLENFKLLTKNAEGANVEMLQGAISSSGGRARVYDPGEGACGYRTKIVAPRDTDSDTVPRITVNQIFESNASPFFPFIVKVDIEGAELDLFSGNTEWVARTPLLIVELHDWLLPKGGHVAVVPAMHFGARS